MRLDVMVELLEFRLWGSRKVALGALPAPSASWRVIRLQVRLASTSAALPSVLEAFRSLKNSYFDSPGIHWYILRYTEWIRLN